MKKRPLIIIFLLLAAVAIGYWQYRAYKGRQSQEMVLYGNIDIREVNLGFRVSGRIAQMLKDEGDTVQAGEVIAQLDDEPYRRDLEQAQAQVASLKAKVQMLENGYRREDVAQAEATLAEREATFANANRLLERQKELIRTKVSSQQEFDDASARLKEAQARVNSARASLALLQAGYRAEELAQAQADLARADAEQKTAAIRLTDTTLKAPSPGAVITRALEPGAIVQPGATVLAISLEDPVWARVYIHEPQLGQVHPGKEVLVSSDSRPDRPYHGKVGYISPRAEFTPKSVETSELRTSLVYRLRIVIEDADPALRQGMPVTARLANK